jgi:hypothetical protein
MLLNFPKRTSTLVGMPAVKVRAPRRFLPVVRDDSRFTPPPESWRVNLPSDDEMLCAQGMLFYLDDLQEMRQKLLEMPDWLPIGRAMDRLSLTIRKTRHDAAMLLRCRCLDLED